MFLSDILLAKRINNFFYIEGHMIKADREATPGYGVLCVFEPSKLDYDFRVVLGPNRFGWFPKAESLKMIEAKLDLSDRFTCDNLRQGEGWEAGPRPYSTKLKNWV